MSTQPYPSTPTSGIRGTLWIVLGDQLDPRFTERFGLDCTEDVIWMAEVTEESTRPASHRARTLLFLAAMRHHAAALRHAGFTVHYRTLGAHDATTLPAALQADLERLQPARVRRIRAGDHRLEQALATTLAGFPDQHDATRDCIDDPGFLVSRVDFADWMRGRREPRMEHFYRWQRKRSGILMEGDQPAGGRWNYDAENRGTFGREGPGLVPPPLGFPPDAITSAARDDIERVLPDLPGRFDAFDWPVTAQQAEAALDDFIEHRLASFGQYQDAMWTDQAWLYHARLAAAMNLRLLDPETVIERAQDAWREGTAPIAAVEGFIRQILGWREYVRGLYEHDPSFWQAQNALDADQPLPALYWTADTDMRCLAEAIGQTLKFGYAHHIQRLMVTGLFAQLLGVRPQEISNWYLGIYVDAVEWVEIPNVVGMSQYADGGFMASKPYVATGKYIQRMSNYCRHCRFDPAAATGETACPFTTLYWDFLAQHKERFARHPRTALQWKNLDRIDGERLDAIRKQAEDHRRQLRVGKRL